MPIPLDPNSGRQRKLRGELRVATKAQIAEGVRDRDFEFLQLVSVLNGGHDVPAPLSAIAKEEGVSRQAVHARVRRLRKRGWLEENDALERKTCGVRLTHNGKLLVETGLGASLVD